MNGRACVRPAAVFAAAGWLTAGVSDVARATVERPQPAQVGRVALPLHFEPDAGQAASGARFVARGRGYSLSVSATEALLVLPPVNGSPGAPDARQRTVRLRLVGANRLAAVSGRQPLPGRSGYFLGSDTSSWRTDVPHFARVAVSEAYPGIDLAYYGRERELEYDFVVRPGADASRIRLEVDGADALRIDERGNLVLALAGGELVSQAPIVYQERNGSRERLAGRYVVEGRNAVRFEVASYDRARPLVIDPVLSYSSYLGGSNGEDSAYAISVDSGGNIYLAGYTQATNFPSANNSPAANTNAFVAKLNPAGSAILYATYIGGSGVDWARAVGVDSFGNAYVAGSTDSTNFPTASAIQPTPGGSTDAFAVKLDPTGNLVYSTYLGGASSDDAWGLAVDPAGSPVVVGSTGSANFPLASAFQPVLGGPSDAFVARIAASGTSLSYSSYLGGKGYEIGYGVALDAAGSPYVTGQTYVSGGTPNNFPTLNALQPTHKGSTASPDAFVSKLAPDGSALVYSTYLGGSVDDFGRAIAVDDAGSAYVVGGTYATGSGTGDFPTTTGAFQTTPPRAGLFYADLFVSKLSPSGASLIWSSYLGGSAQEWGIANAEPVAIAADAAGRPWITGTTQSPDFPARRYTVGKFAASRAGFVTAFEPDGSGLHLSDYLGGTGIDEARAIAIGPSGDAYVAGLTFSADFPVVSPLQGTAPGNGDAFVARVAASPSLPSLSIADTTVVEAGGANLAFDVTLSQSSGQTITVDYATVNTTFAGTASGGSDYTSVSGTLTFAPGTTSQQILVPVLTDSLSELDETVFMHLSAVSAGAFVLDGDGVGVIADDEPVPTISIADAAVNESAAQASLAVTLSRAAAYPITAGYSTADGTALAGSDYDATTGTITFAAGTTSQAAAVRLRPDARAEASETLLVTLQSPSSPTTIADGEATVTITDTSGPPSVAVADTSVAEGGSAVFTVTLSAASDATVTVNYATSNGTASAGSDYTSTSGTLSFAPGTTTQTVSVATSDDGTSEAAETLTLTLSSPVNATLTNGNQYLFAGLSGTGQLQFFNINPSTGALTKVPSAAQSMVFASTPGNASIANPQVLAASPTGAFALTADGQAASPFAKYLSSYAISATDGRPGINAEAPAAMGTTVIDGVAVHPNGRWVYAGQGGVSLFELDPATGKLTRRTGNLTGLGPGLGLEPAGRYLFRANSSGSNFVVSAFGIHPDSGIPYASGSQSFSSSGNNVRSIAVHPNGRYVYVVDGSGKVHAVWYDQVAGTFATVAGSPFTVGTTPVAIALTPSGGFAYVANSGSNNVSAFSVNAATGVLTSLGPAVAVGTSPQAVSVSPAGQFLYVANSTANSVSAFTIGGGGALTAIAGQPFATGGVSASGTPNRLAVAQQKADATAQATITDNDGPVLSVVDTSVPEGAFLATTNVTVTVSLSPASGSTVTVNYATANGTAVIGDYLGTAGTLTFAAGQTSRTFTVTVRGDNGDEPDETVLVNLSSPSGAGVLDGQGAVTILDDDPTPALSVGDAIASEGGNLSFSVTLSSQSGVVVTAPFQALAGSATAGQDFTPSSGVVTFPVGGTAATITVPTLTDSLNEGDESLSLTFGAPDGATLADGQGVGTIADANAAPVISLGDVSISEGPAGTRTALVPVRVSAPAAAPVTASFATSDGSALAGADYGPASGSLTIPAGATEATIAVDVLGDLAKEPNESFEVALSGPGGAVLADGGMVVGAGLPLTVEAATGTLLRAGAYVSGPPVSGRYQVAAAAGRLYACGGTSTIYGYRVDAASGALVEMVGAPFAVASVCAGVAADPLGRFLFTFEYSSNTVSAYKLLQPSGVPQSVAGGPLATGTSPQFAIVDGTGRFLYVANFSSGTVSQFSIGQTTGALTAIGAPVVTVASPYALATDAAGKFLFVTGFASGSNNLAAFTIHPTTGALTAVAGGGVYSVTGAPRGSAVDPTGAHLYVVTPTSGIFGYAIDSGTGALSPLPGFPTAYPGTGGGESVAISTSGRFLYAYPSRRYARDLATGALSESADLSAGSPMVAVPRADARGTVTILDDDASISIGDVNVLEGSSGATTATFTVSLDAPSSDPVTVSWATAPSSATAPADFTATSGTLTFAPGVTSQTLDVTVIGDALDEDDETFVVDLSSPVGAALLDGQGVGTIQDDDAPPSLSISGGSATEGHTGSVTLFFTATLSSPSGRSVSVAYASSDDTASAGVDYVASSGTLVIPPGSPTGAIAVPVVGDYDDEPDETLLVTLSLPTHATLGVAQAAGTILDDDLPLPPASIGDATVSESAASVTLTVSLGYAVPRDVSVSWSTSDGTASAGADYVAAAGTLSFSAGQTSRTLSVLLRKDWTDEDDESFFVELGSPVNLTIGDGQAAVTLQDDDDPPTLRVYGGSVSEGDAGMSTASFEAALSASSERTVSVAYTTVDGSAVQPSDYGPSSGTLVFAPGETRKMVAVPVVGDTLLESTETFSLVLSSPVNATLAGADPRALYATSRATDAIHAFGIADDGSLSPLAGSPRPAGRDPWTPRLDPLRRFVWTQTEDPPSPGSLYTERYSVNALTGALSSLGSAGQRFDLQAIEPRGRFGFAAGSTQVFRETIDGATGALGFLPAVAGTGPVALHPSGAFLYVADAGSSALAGYAVADTGGTLSALAGSPFAIGADPSQLAFEPGGRFLYALESGANLAAYEVDPSTGSLAPVAGTPFATALTATGIAIDPLGRFLFVATTAGLHGFALDPGTGVATPLVGSPFDPSRAFFDVALDPRAQHLYAAESAGLISQVRAYAVAPSTGGLAELPYSPFLLGSETPSGLNAVGKLVATAETGPSAVARIVNDEPVPSVSVGDASVTEGNGGEAGDVTLTFTVSLSGSSLLPGAVDFYMEDGTATNGSDYLGFSGTLNFPAGVTTATVDVTVPGDSLSEANETFLLKLRNPIDLVLGDAVAAGTITDDDAQPSLSIDDVTVTEGDVAGNPVNAVLTVSLSGVSGQTVTVDYTPVDGTATGADHGTLGGALSFPPGTLQRLVSIPVTRDDFDEDDESFSVVLSGAVGAALADATGLVTILDNDPLPGVGVTNAPAIAEGNSGTQNAVFHLLLSAPSGRTVSVSYATSLITATPGVDFTATSGTATIPPGTTDVVVNVPVIGDALYEGNESFLLEITGATNAVPTFTQGIGTINDDDGVPVVTITDTEVQEGDAGTRTLVFTVTWSGASALNTSVQCDTRPLTASSGLDYQETVSTVNFGPGSGVVTQTCSVPVFGDIVDEADEIVIVDLVNPVNAVVGSPNLAWGVIRDDDASPAVSIGDASVTEGDAGDVTLSFQLSLAFASQASYTVNWATADETATSGTLGDYVSASGSVTFAAGQTAASIGVTVRGDWRHELNETLLVNLTGLGGLVAGDTQARGTIVDQDPVPTLTIGDVSHSEGDSNSSAGVTLTLSNLSGLPISVSFTTADGSAVAGADYVATSGSFSFPPDDLVATLPVTIVGDLLDEDPEAFEIRFSSPVNVNLPDTAAVVTLQDFDPAPSATIADVSLAEGSGGGTSASFVVTLSRDSGRVITIGYATRNVSALAGSDYTAATGTLTIPPGATSGTIDVAVNPDPIDEPVEVFELELSNPQAVGLFDTLAVATINDDDPPPSVSVTGANVAEGHSGATPLGFTVALSLQSAFPITVGYATQDFTALAGADYVAQSGTLSFAPGETSKTVTVQVVGEMLVEVDEGFTLALSGPTNATLGAATATGTIANDDVVYLNVGDVAIAEGAAGTSDAVFTVSLTSESALTTTVQYATANGTASAADYLGQSGTLSFAPGEMSKAVSVPVIGDALDEANETFFVNLSSPVNATLLDGQGLGTISDDDPPPVMSVSDVSVAEGDAGNASLAFNVALSAPSGLPIAVDYATSDLSAAAGSDYAAAAGTLSFAPGETGKSVTILVAGDTTHEATETLRLTLSGASNASLGVSQATGTITNDDAAPSLSIGDLSIAEGASGTTSATFTVTLSAASGLTTTVAWATADGSGVAGTDYVTANGTLTFAPGTSSRTFVVGVLGNTIDQDDRNFQVALSGAVNATIADAQATGTINDDDDAPAINIGGTSHSEGNAGSSNATLTVSLSNPSARPITVAWATSNGTASTADYQPGSGTLSFAALETSKSVQVAVSGDLLDENNETVTVTLSAPTNATLGTSSGTLTILDDDLPPSLSIGDATVGEGSTAFFTLGLSAVSGLPVGVTVATANGSATAPADYAALTPTVVTIPAGSLSTSVSVSIGGDALDEDDETFSVTLSSPTNATLSDAAGVGTITDDDATPTLTIGPVTVAEGNAGNTPMAFALTLSAASGKTVSVAWATDDDTAVAGVDYTAASSTATIAPGSTSGSITVNALGNALDQDNRAFRVNLSSPVNATLMTTQALGTIQDDDPQPSVGITDVTLDEGNSGTREATFVVSLSAASGKPVSVSFATVSGTAAEGSDYSAASGALSFDPGVTSRTIAVSVLGDLAGEDDEQFSVQLSGPSNASLGDGYAVGIIRDDDLPRITSPAPGSSLPAGPFTFTWTAGSATGITNFWLSVGTTVGGGDILARPVAGFSKSVYVGYALHSSATEVHVRLRYYVPGSGWQHRDYTYALGNGEEPLSRIVSPVPGSEVSGLTTFAWSPLPAQINWWDSVTQQASLHSVNGLGVGSAWGAADLFGLERFTPTCYYGPNDYRPCPYQSQRETFLLDTNAKTVGLPAAARNARQIWLRLQSRGYYARTLEYAYMQANSAPWAGRLTGPTLGSIVGSTATFTWTGSADRYWLLVRQGGQTLFQGEVTGGSQSVTGIVPGLYNRVSVRLDSASNADGSIASNEYEFLSIDPTPTAPQLTEPAPFTTLHTPSTTFRWQPGQYSNGTSLYAYTSWPSYRQLFNGYLAGGVEATVSGLPADGTPVWVQLWGHPAWRGRFADYPRLGEVTSFGSEPPLAGNAAAAAAPLDDPQPSPLLILDQVTVDDAGGNGNSRIDPDECLTIDVRLKNVGTAPATNVSASLTTPAGLSVANAAAFGTIAPGATASASVPFRVSAGSALVPGTPLAFQVEVDSTEGATTLPFGLDSGSPAPPQVFTTSPATAIPDLDPYGVASTLSVNGVDTPIVKAAVRLAVAHTRVSDLDLTLVAPDGTSVLLASDVGGAGANFGTDAPADANDTLFDDAAAQAIGEGAAPFVGAFRPLQGLSTLNGKAGAAVNGDWTLVVRDLKGGHAGTLLAWSLELSPYNATGGGACTPEMSAEDATVSEGDSGQRIASFGVQLSTASEKTVTVGYATAPGSASAGADFVPTSGTLTFPPGQARLTIDVPVNGDVLDEAAESFVVNLSGATNATLARPQGVATIVDDDAQPTLSIGDVTVTEGNSGTVAAVFTVSLSAPSGQTVTVSAQTANGSASASSDYSAAGPLTLSFDPGVTSRTFSVPVLGDLVDEPDESFFVNLSSAANAGIADAQGVGTITDDDVFTPPLVSIGGAAPVKEGNAGTTNASFPVTLSFASAQAVTVDYSAASGTATSGVDFAVTSGTLTFNPGETSKTILVAVLGDTLNERPEGFSVSLSNAAGATLGVSTGTGTIRDDEDRIVELDGDTRSDLVVFHEASGLWFLRNSSTGAVTALGFGGVGYTPVPGDYDGDGITDVAAYHAPSGLWFVRHSSTLATTTAGFGGIGYAPVRGDFDGDGRTDLAVFHEVSGLWFVKNSSNGSVATIGFGGPGYLTVPGDYDGDGTTDLAVYHPPSGLWFVRNSSTLLTTANGFGAIGYAPVRGDFDGDGKTDLAVVHQASGLWFVKNSSNGGVTTIGFGGPAFKPVVGKYDADGKADIAVYHPPSGLWYWKNSTNGATSAIGFGGPGYAPVN